MFQYIVSFLVLGVVGTVTTLAVSRTVGLKHPPAPSAFRSATNEADYVKSFAHALPTSSPSPTLGGLPVSDPKDLYYASNVVVSDTPFPFLDDGTKTTSSASRETRSNGDVLTAQIRMIYHGVFKVAVGLPSGMRFNFFTSSWDAKRSHVSIDPRALNVLVTQTIERSAQIRGPFQDHMKLVKAEADAGRFNRVIDVVAFADRGWCLQGRSANGSLDEAYPEYIPAPRGKNYCMSNGLDNRLHPIGTPSLNQFIVLVNNEGIFDAQLLDSNQTITWLLAHELGHAEFDGNFTGNQEHDGLVTDLQNETYWYLRGLAADQQRFLQAVRVS